MAEHTEYRTDVYQNEPGAPKDKKNPFIPGSRQGERIYAQVSGDAPFEPGSWREEDTQKSAPLTAARVDDDTAANAGDPVGDDTTGDGVTTDPV